VIRYRLPVAVTFVFVLLSVVPAPAAELSDLFGDVDDLVKDVDENRKKLDQMRGKVSKKEEIRLGGNLVAGFLGAAPLVDDPELQRYVNDVGYWVAQQSKRRKLPWRFGVIDSKGINAFAAPGGYILITLGLYQLLENEAQLAGVLAHEISHVVRKHHLKVLQKTMRREFLSEITLKTVDAKKTRERVNQLIGSGLKLYTTGLDRRYEYDADLRGVVLAARAGYDPYAFLDVLTTIDSINPASAELAVLINTHPPTADRLETLARKMDDRLDSYALGVDNAKRFRQIRAKH